MNLFMQKLSLKIFIKKMNKENLASIITRLYFCNNTKLENKDEYTRMKNYLLALNENDFCQKLWEFGFYDKDAS